MRGVRAGRYGGGVGARGARFTSSQYAHSASSARCRSIRLARRAPLALLARAAELFHLRSSAIHAPETITVESAKEYATQARRLVAFLRELEK